MKRDKGLPPLPSHVFSHLGLIPVLRKKLKGVIGRTQPAQRIITVTPDQHPAQAWQTYWHECVHLALWDAGLKLPNEIEERLCDVIGTYLAAAVRAGFLEIHHEVPEGDERE